MSCINISVNKTLTADITVAGGGMAGVCCALEIARSGFKVILVQDRPVLGGNASSEVRMHVCGADGMRGEIGVTEAREGGIIEEIRLHQCIHNSQRSPFLQDLHLYDLCRSEENMILMLNTSVVNVKMNNTKDSIECIYLQRASTEDVYEVKSSLFVDATGDGFLGFSANADFVVGREGENVYGETLAISSSDNKTLGSSLLYMAKKHDKEMPFTPPEWARRFNSEDLKLRPIGTRGGLDCGWEYGFWWCEWGGQLNTIKDNELIRDELLSILLGIWDYLKNSGNYPDSNNWALDWIGFVPGKRESRRFLGDYVITEHTVRDAPNFEDTIAYGGWPIDTHPPEGVDAPNQPPCLQNTFPYLFEIPLRACYSRNIKNLFFAGRNISASHIGFASTRVMGTCAVIGQGVGAAATECIRRGLVPSELVNNEISIFNIQQQLLRNDCFLPGVLNQDPNDLARHAKISASSENIHGEATLVLSGQTRSVHGAKGVRGDNAHPGFHRWMSNSSGRLPQWIKLEWDKPIYISKIMLIFDSSLHERLTLTMADAFAEKMRWGEPREFLVDRYSIEGVNEDGQNVLAENARSNHQRRCVHIFNKILVKYVKITVISTFGSKQARICEVRCYDNAESY